MMSSTAESLSRTLEANACHYHCKNSRNLIGSHILFLPVLRIKSIFLLFIKIKNTEEILEKKTAKSDLEADSDEKYLLIQTMMNHILDAVFEVTDATPNVSVSDFKNEEICELNSMDRVETEQEYNDEGQNCSNFIIDYIINTVIEKAEKNWLKDYCNNILNNILQNITDVLSISSIWPNFHHSYEDNAVFKHEEINLNSVFVKSYDVNSTFFKTKKKPIKKHLKNKENVVPQIDIKHSVIGKVPSMQSSKSFICDPQPQYSIVVEIDELESCEENNLHTEKFKKVIFMKYTSQKVIQTKLNKNSVTSQTQTKTNEKVKIRTETLAIWCHLLVDSMLMVIPVRKVQKESVPTISQLRFNTQLDANLLFSTHHSVPNTLAFIEMLLNECTNYQNTLNTCSCKMYVKKHYFLSLVLNIFYILTKFLALITYYQRKNMLMFANKTTCLAIYLRCYSYLLNFYDDNEIVLTENFLKFEDFSKIHNSFSSLILNLNFSSNDKLKKANVFLIYKKLIQQKLEKILKIQSWQK